MQKYECGSGRCEAERLTSGFVKPICCACVGQCGVLCALWCAWQAGCVPVKVDEVAVRSLDAITKKTDAVSGRQQSAE
jgi:hypothetical protein